jgi:hypothetical protein
MYEGNLLCGCYGETNKHHEPTFSIKMTESWLEVFPLQLSFCFFVRAQRIFRSPLKDETVKPQHQSNLKSKLNSQLIWLYNW